MQRERIPPLKIILYIAVFILLFVLESANGMPVRVMGYRVDILPFAVASVALLDGPVEGASMGLFAGVLYDVAYRTADGLYPVFYLLVGLAAGLLGHRFLRRIYPSALVLGTASMLLLGLWRLAVAVLMRQTGDPLLFLQSVCGQTLVAAALSCIAYLPVRAVSRRFVKSEVT